MKTRRLVVLGLAAAAAVYLYGHADSGSASLLVKAEDAQGVDVSDGTSAESNRRP
jgi:hypothetical protein